MPRTECLTAEELNALHLGDLPETALQELAAHLEKCARCEAAAQALDDMADTVAAAYRQSVLARPLASPTPVRVGDYEILGEIGRGGMGVVYKARHKDLRRTVALKMLLDGAFSNGEERARFRAEAEAVARLQHGNIIQIYEIGEHTAEAGVHRPFFTLEFAEGGNLATRMGGRPQPSRQAAAWVEVLARAAHYAHERGIVHRDLKPSNVLLTADDQPKICDFGVAKFLTGAGIKTISGTVLGTAEYMAPEQASGQSVIGPAADVYALGAILYTALTGRPPFQATSVWHTLEQVVRQDPVPPRQLQPGVPRDLETICLKCLEKEPARRYASAEALADDLRRFLADQPILARRPSLWERGARWVRHHKAGAAAIAIITVTLVAAATISTVEAVQKDAERRKAMTAEAEALAAQKRAETAQQLAEKRRELAVRSLYLAGANLTGMTLDGPGGVTRVGQFLRDWRGSPPVNDPRGWEWLYCQTLANPAQMILRGHLADAASLAWSPDGERLASGGFDKTIRIWDAHTGRQIRRIAAPWGILAVSWSPDGRRLASANWSEKSVSLWDPTSGKEVRARLSHPYPLHTVAFNPDGQRLAAADYGGLTIVWDTTTGKPLFQLQDAQHPNQGEVSLCWSPDGRRLANSWSGNTIAIWDGKTGKMLARLTGHTGRVTTVRWAPDGRRLASVSEDKTIRIWDMTSYRELKQTATLTDTLEDALNWSPDGTRLAAGGRDLIIRVWDVNSGEVQLNLAGHTASRISAVRWSPDGLRLASGERGWNGAVMVWNVKASAGRSTFAVGRAGDPHLQVCWGPDSRKLATAHQDGTIKLWDVSTRRCLGSFAAHAGMATVVAWSSDGRKLASGGSDGTIKLWDSQTHSLLKTWPGNGHAVASLSWAPDETRLACGTLDDSVVLCDVQTGTARVAGFRGGRVAWSPKENRLAVGDGTTLRIHDADTDRKLSEWTGLLSHYNWPHWSPDGKRIAIIADYVVEVRDAATGRPVFAPLGHTQRVQAIAWSPDSKQLASATEDNRVHLWDASIGNAILTLPRGDAAGPIHWIAWSPDGMRLACAGRDGKVTLWDASRGYKGERAPALLKLLNARLAAQPDDRAALRLRAGVNARLGAWDQAAADAERLTQATGQAFFQAGWWIAEMAEPDMSQAPNVIGCDPFKDVAPAEAPRWYVSADDPNGYVPLAKEQPYYLTHSRVVPSQEVEQPYYLTRVYTRQERQVELRLEGNPRLTPHLWVNGTAVPVRAPMPITMPITLAKGWNTLAVQLNVTEQSASVLMQQRIGIHLRLNAAVGAK